MLAAWHAPLESALKVTLLPPVFTRQSRIHSQSWKAGNYSNRWHNEVILRDVSEIDDEFLTWVRAAYAFTA
jgi:hypothetical protein